MSAARPAISFLRGRWTWLYLAALGGLWVWSIADPAGLARRRRLEAEVRRATRENLELRQENLRLRREARALAGEPAALERAAREELGFVRQGEIVYQLEAQGGARP